MNKKSRQLNGTDRLLAVFNNAINTLIAQEPPSVYSDQEWAANSTEVEGQLTAEQKRCSARLLRINHTGEVCAQALYLGQASQASHKGLRDYLQASANEEQAHLKWCNKRIAELGGKTSKLNPIFYGLSFGLGAAIARTGDANSLGFIHATETLVADHLQQHVEKLPSQDIESKNILSKMLEDEQAHADQALLKGGKVFSKPKLKLMWAGSRVMTFLSSRF